jgi:hypothetical protein
MIPSKILCALFCFPAVVALGVEPQVVPLWPNGAPRFREPVRRAPSRQGVQGDRQAAAVQLGDEVGTPMA